MKQKANMAARLVHALFCLQCLSIGSFAQSAAALRGKVTNKTSKPVAGATIHLLNTNRFAVTDASGAFIYPSLAPGNYQLEVTAIGYATAHQDVSLSSGQGQPLSITLSESGRKLDEVIVTAQKKEELLQQVPIGVTAISARQVQEYRLWNSKDLTAIVPNLYSSDPGDHRNVTAIRGITTTSYVPAVATYIDGVNQFGLDTYIPVLLDVERIEVLRGPQGTLYGRNAMGGVVNIITRQPSNRTSAFVQVDAGNYHQRKFTAGLRTPLIKDKLYLGVTAMSNQYDGYYHNDFNNAPYEKQESLTGNYYLRYLPGHNWSVTLNVKHHNNRNQGPFPLVPDKESALLQPFTLSQNALTTMVDNTQNASLAVSYAGKGINFSSQTSWQKNYRYYKSPLDGDFSPLDAISIINNFGKDWNNVKAVTQEVKFSSSTAAPSPLQWTAGAYLFYQNNPTQQGTRFGADANLLGIGDSLFTTVTKTKSETSGAAVFGQATYTVNSKFDLTLGLRYDYEYQRQNVSGSYQHDPDPVFITTFPDTSANATFHAFSPKASVAYHFDAASMAYLSYSRGFRAGGLTPLSSDPSQPPLYAFKPEYSNNFELGVKNELFDQTTRLNLYAFYNNNTNAQVPTLVLPDAVTITRNTGKLVTKGLEAELLTRPVKALEIGYNFGYTHARFKTLRIAQNGSSVDLAGKRQIFTPDITSMLAAQYSYNFGGMQQLKAVARAEWRYMGETYFDLANNIRQSPYQIVNLRAGIAAPNFEIMFWVRNLTNKKYISYAYDFGAVRLGDPKTYGITLMARID